MLVKPLRVTIAADSRLATNLCCSEERMSGALISRWSFVGEGLASRSPGFDAPKLGLLMQGCVSRTGRFDLQQRLDAVCQCIP
jgi:hypothetical protein